MSYLGKVIPFKPGNDDEIYKSDIKETHLWVQINHAEDDEKANRVLMLFPTFV